MTNHFTAAILFQFPSNGKARVNSPHFRPRRAVGPNTPKPNTNCAGLFSHEKLPRKSHKPLWPLNQTRFFTKNGLEPKQALGSTAILNAFGPDWRIAFVFKILREIPKNVNPFLRFFLKTAFSTQTPRHFRMHTPTSTENAPFPKPARESLKPTTTSNVFMDVCTPSHMHTITRAFVQIRTPEQHHICNRAPVHTCNTAHWR